MCEQSQGWSPGEQARPVVQKTWLDRGPGGPASDVPD